MPQFYTAGELLAAMEPDKSYTARELAEITGWPVGRVVYFLTGFRGLDGVEYDEQTHLWKRSP